MKKIFFLLLAIAAAVYFLSRARDKDALFQFSTFGALRKGAYQGGLSVRELKRHGNFGLGTFDSLDGEMVELGGRVYQIKTDGLAYPVKGEIKTPFASVTFFDVDYAALLSGQKNYQELSQYLDSVIPTKNIFYAIKIKGIFNYLKVRSVPRQNKPYPPLDEVVKKQSVFELRDIQGVLVGFRSPECLDTLNFPGYHFHFLDSQKQRGGHVLDCDIKSGIAEIDETGRFLTVLPASKEFYRLDFSAN